MKLWYDDAPTPSKIARDIAGLLIKAGITVAVIWYVTCLVLAIAREFK